MNARRPFFVTAGRRHHQRDVTGYDRKRLNEQADKDRREQRAGDGIEENNEELGDEAPKVGTSVMVLTMCRWLVEWIDYGNKRKEKRSKWTSYARAKLHVFCIYFVNA